MAPNLDLQSEELGQVKDGHVVLFLWGKVIDKYNIGIYMMLHDVYMMYI